MTNEKLRGWVFDALGVPKSGPARSVAGWFISSNSPSDQPQTPLVCLSLTWAPLPRLNGVAQHYSVRIGDTIQRVIINGKDQASFERLDVDTLIVRNGEYAVTIRYGEEIDPLTHGLGR